MGFLLFCLLVLGFSFGNTWPCRREPKKCIKAAEAGEKWGRESSSWLRYKGPSLYGTGKGLWDSQDGPRASKGKSSTTLYLGQLNNIVPSEAFVHLRKTTIKRYHELARHMIGALYTLLYPESDREWGQRLRRSPACLHLPWGICPGPWEDIHLTSCSVGPSCLWGQSARGGCWTAVKCYGQQWSWPQPSDPLLPPSPPTHASGSWEEREVGKSDFILTCGMHYTTLGPL